MYTDPEHIHIEQPGHLEGNTVFTYLDAFCLDSDFEKFLPDYKNLQQLKDHYTRGGLGDGTCKKFLLNILNDRLEPMRQRRKVYEQDIEGVYDILRRGTEEARKVAQETIKEVRHAMRIDYFDDKELISTQAKYFKEKNNIK
jgi:tryptophanyl-tRNA synthetase